MINHLGTPSSVPAQPTYGASNGCTVERSTIDTGTVQNSTDGTVQYIVVHT